MAGPIIHLSFSGDYGGREKVAVELNRSMNDLGCESWLFMVLETRAGESRNANLIHQISDQPAIVRFETSSRFSYSLLKKLRQALDEKHAKVFHCHCYKSLAYALLIKKVYIHDAIVVLTLHGLVVPEGESGWLIRLVQLIGLWFADGVIGCSAEILQRTLPQGWKGATVAIINSLRIESENYEQVRAGNKGARAAVGSLYSFDAAKLIVINVGRLSHEKGFSLYLHTVRDIVDRGDATDTMFLVVGDGPLKEKLVTECHELGLDDHVRFTGFVTDMPKIYEAADLIVQTSFMEGTPMCILEARANGLPSVVPAIGGNPDIVHEGTDGILFPVGDAESAAGAIVDYLKSETRRREHGAKAFEDVATRYNHKSWVSHHVDFYNELLKSRTKKG